MLDTSEQVYTFIRSYIQEHGYSPSLRDIASGCYINVASVARYLDKLEAKGLIKRELGKARSISLVESFEN